MTGKIDLLEHEAAITTRLRNVVIIGTSRVSSVQDGKGMVVGATATANRDGSWNVYGHSLSSDGHVNWNKTPDVEKLSNVNVVMYLLTQESKVQEHIRSDASSLRHHSDGNNLHISTLVEELGILNGGEKKPLEVMRAPENFIAEPKVLPPHSNVWLRRFLTLRRGLSTPTN